ncbi:Uu.00g058450.m01.CDS01 [Anthostomella pinea]|uniref:Uu.00g058450.m01.CDS01 n=1 Tax=Anthostomella pinea TaxID=933095 RepID=A0AAI8VRX0_9PEZI|nr:Uu.00g058450.m01.CDS01 [Anthostomella pinea]
MAGPNMAALTPAHIELANSLTQDELPTKLRCAICSKLAIEAFRLPCCETAICENCQSTLPSSCPVCEHSPVSGADCTVYKSLRITIRVFLKTEEKKREAARPKTTSSVPPTPVEATPTPIQTQGPTVPPAAEPVTAVDNEPESASTEPAPTEPAVPIAVPGDDKAATSENVVNGLPEQGSPVTNTSDEPKIEPVETDRQVSEVQTNGGAAGVEPSNEGAENADVVGQSEQAGTHFGLNAMNGNYNMSFGGGDMSQMQMMMAAMQNGMNPAAFGAFNPMMGMMDPMAMQNMMMSGGFGAQGMGMNGMNMNMNMGMNGFNGGGSDWNGQQSWNVGQDNFNPSAPGMGNGDFGNFNAGSRTGNFGHHNQFNDYRRGNYAYRGRGRGRGFYGGYSRGNHQGYNGSNAGWGDKTSQFAGTNDGQPTTSNDAQASEAMQVKVDEFGRTIRTDSEGHDVAEGSQAPTTAPGDNDLASEKTEQVVKDPVSQSAEAQHDSANSAGDVPSADVRSNSQGPTYRSLSSVPQQAVVPDVPLNAPKGPKAMLQGLPNTSLHHLKSRGLITDERSPSLGTDAPVVASPMKDRAMSRSSSLHSRKDNKDRRRDERRREHDLDEKSRGREYERGPSQSRTHSVSKSRSRSRDRKETRRHRRHRSPSLSGDSRDDEHRRKKHRSKRQSTRDDDDYKSRPREDKYDRRSRSASPIDREYKRSDHRNQRNRDEKRRDRDKDREKEDDYDRSRKSGHRSHRDRGEGRERDKEREKERDRAHGKDRARTHEKDHRHRSSKVSNTAPPTPVEPSDKGFNPPTGPRGSFSIFSIKGASSKPLSALDNNKPSSSRSSNPHRRESESSRRASQSSTAGHKLTSGGPAKDAHTLEREARDRERLLKEAQRIAGLTGLAGRAGVKRSREGADDRGGRRKSRRSEAVSTEDEEQRMRRLEAEREGRRWD